MAWLWGVIGALFGAMLGELPGLVAGAAIGAVGGHVVELGRRLRRTEEQLRQLQLQLQRAASAAQPGGTPPPPPAATRAPQPFPPAPAPTAPEVPGPHPVPLAAREALPASISLPADFEFDASAARPAAAPRGGASVEASAGAPAARAPAGGPPAAGHDSREAVFAPWEAVVNFFTRGNPVVSVGLVVLFFGFAFLLKYAAQHDLVPIEVRYLGAAAAGLGLFAFGWRERHRRELFSLLLQGGGVGVLYLVVFAAFRLHGLLPAGLAFLLMVALTVVAGALAVLQDSRQFAWFAAAGGFLAPLLASTNAGNHVALFSYYALLNFGVLGVAWFRAWRELNLLGFLFTFVIATLWGYLRYEPALFGSTEPFLILFYLTYLAVAVLYALRRPPELRGLVDGTLVFGLPVIGFALQAALVREMEFGLAYSALALGALYLGLATLLFRRGGEGLRLLSETFLALGVGFGSLAIPLALNNRWTSAAWALEGAGLVWIGVRQARLAARLFGLLLQFGAGLFFLADRVQHGLRPLADDGALPFTTAHWLGALCLALAGMVSAYQLRRTERLREWEWSFEYLLVGWAIIWWSVGWLGEFERVFPGQLRQATVIWIAASALLLAMAGRRWQWRAVTWPPLAAGPLLALLALQSLGQAGGHPFAEGGWFAWPLALVGLYGCAFLLEERPPAGRLAWLHLPGLWLILFLVTAEAAWLLGRLAEGPGWGHAAWGALPALGLLLLPTLCARLPWPCGSWRESYLFHGALAVALWSLAWLLWASVGTAGGSAPLPYLPLLNPVEIAQLLVLFAVYDWLRREAAAFSPELEQQLTVALAGAGFVALNGLLGRSVHYFADVPYNWGLLLRSVELQALFSVVWSLLALFGMVVAARGGRRTLWFAGAVLLGVVVLKLFLVDLAGANTVSRIVSFLAVGALMLVIGFFSPLPPREEERR